MAGSVERYGDTSMVSFIESEALTVTEYEKLTEAARDEVINHTRINTYVIPSPLSSLLQKLNSSPDRDWQRRSACKGVDPNLFFPERDSKEAKDVCKSCPVREDCLEYALSHNEKYGIWGGESERSRRRILRQRAMARRAVASQVQTIDQ